MFSSLGPAVARVPLKEALRAGGGALLGLALVALLILPPAPDLASGLFLIAPFGASSILLFAAPNSPLAQPWSAIVGNTLAALVALAVCWVIGDPVLRLCLSVALTIVVTMLARAVHPPAGAVAMTVAMSPELVDQLGLWFALTPVALGTSLLVAVAAIYAPLTGRRYPFRQFSEASPNATADRAAPERLGLSKTELTQILERYRQSFNLGVEDLARLIGAAEIQAAAHGAKAEQAEDIMSRDLITVAPDTSLTEVIALFHRHRFTSLPVVGPEMRFLGVIFQIHLVERAAEVLQAEGVTRLSRLVGASTSRRFGLAKEVMSSSVPKATQETPIAALLHLLSDGAVDAVPVLEGERIVGIVTRTDLVAALSRISARSAAGIAGPSLP